MVITTAGHERPILSTITIYPRISTAVYHQEQIGWHLYVKGFQSKQWAIYLNKASQRPQAQDNPLQVDQFLTGLTKVI